MWRTPQIHTPVAIYTDFNENQHRLHANVSNHPAIPTPSETISGIVEMQEIIQFVSEINTAIATSPTEGLRIFCPTSDRLDFTFPPEEYASNWDLPASTEEAPNTSLLVKDVRYSLHTPLSPEICLPEQNTHLSEMLEVRNVESTSFETDELARLLLGSNPVRDLTNLDGVILSSDDSESRGINISYHRSNHPMRDINSIVYPTKTSTIRNVRRITPRIVHSDGETAETGTPQKQRR